MRLFNHEPEVSGYITAHDLKDWWRSELTDDEREYLASKYEPLMAGDRTQDDRRRVLVEGQLPRATHTFQFLTGLAGWPDAAHRELAKKVLKQAAHFYQSAPVIQQHFFWQCVIKTYYPDRHHRPDSLHIAVRACEEQIAMAPQVAEAMRDDERERAEHLKSLGMDVEFTDSLPRHTGYEQLAIIREKGKGYSEAIRLSSEAMKQGWNGDWQKRIDRCTAKLDNIGR
jgi:hypothetical protein